MNTKHITAEKSVRKVDFTSDGFTWQIASPDCPMKVHTDALGQKAKLCSAGLMTNAQGCVIVALCKHYQKDSIRSKGKGRVIDCVYYVDPPLEER